MNVRLQHCLQRGTEMAEQPLHYDAFISYRHAELDKAVASGMLRRLESFRLPSLLGRDLPKEKRRITRIFRDQDELPLSSNLSDPIEEALEHSDWLIVICSPRLPESKWCAREIARFTQLHGKEHILTVLAEGDISESVPPEAVYDPDRPVTADVRTGDSQTDSRLLAKRMDDAVFALAARMLGQEETLLRQRHREQRVRRTLALSLTLTGALLAFGIYCVSRFLTIRSQNQTIVTQQDELKEAYTAQQQRYARSMAGITEELLSDGRRLDAVYGLLSAMPATSKDRSVPYEASAERALAKALAVYETDVFIPEGTEEFDPDADMDDSDDYEWLSVEERYRWWPKGWSGLEEYIAGHVIVSAAEREDGSILIIGNDGSLYSFDPESGYLDNYPLLLYSVPPREEVVWADYDGSSGTLCLLTSENTFLNYSSSAWDKIVYRWKDRSTAGDAGSVEYREIEEIRHTALLPLDSSLSDDGRYRLIVRADGALEISPAGESPMNTLAVLDEPGYSYCGMKRLGDTGRYAVIGTGKGEVLDAFILNESLEVTALIQRYYGFDEGNGQFLQYCYDRQEDRFDPAHANPLKLVGLPLISYDELIAEAERRLSGYQPSETVFARYKMLK